MKTPRFSIRAVLIAIATIAVMIAGAIWHFDIPHSTVEKIPWLHGKTDAQIFRKLGKPSHEYSFTMDKPLGEFQIPLYNTYPPGSPNNSNIQIRECTWEYPEHRLTVWLHKPHKKWEALDACRYGSGIVF